MEVETKNKVRPGYRQTEVGAIPEGWAVKAVDEIAKVKGGKRLPLGKSLIDKTTLHPYIRVTDMRFGRVMLDDIKYVPEDVFPTIKNYRIFIADIFISVAGTLGIVGKIPPELDGANLTENADKITDIICDRDFLLYNLMSDRIQGIIEAEKTVGAQPKLALTRIGKFKVGLPPATTEQRAIATALSDADALTASLDKLITKKRDIKTAAMQQLLTGKRRLPEFSGKWEVKRLGDVADIDPENLGSDTNHAYSFKYISLEDVDVGILRGYTEQIFGTAPSRARRKVRKGDVLVSTVRPNLKSHLLIRDVVVDTVCSTGFSVVRCKPAVADSAFVYFHFVYGWH
jgi:restriction endonuclease S subunit